MRRIIKPGAKCCAFCCPFCGQVEILTEGDELNKCSNCGTEMLPAEELTKPVTFGSEKEIKEKQAEIDKLCGIIAERPPQYVVPPATPDPELDKGTPPTPAPPKKKGRPPKQPTQDKPQRKGDEPRCGNCGKAMKAMRDYTCKETCEAVRPGAWCEKYKRGTPMD